MRRHSFIKQAAKRSNSILRISLESPVIIPILKRLKEFGTLVEKLRSSSFEAACSPDVKTVTMIPIFKIRTK